MNVKAAKSPRRNGIEAAVWQDKSHPAPTFTARERLHQNILRLQSLEKELFTDPLNKNELLTAIELVGFRIRHLASQIQTAEQFSRTSSPSTEAP